MNLDFSGKTVVVTGAAHGFGRAISLAFAVRGANVWACDVVADELRETQHLGEAATRGRVFETRVVDVTERRDMDAFVAEACADQESVGVLVNNAGGVLGQVGRPLEEITGAQWQRIFDVNVSGAFFCSQ